MEDNTWFSPGFTGGINDLHVDNQARDEWWQQLQGVTQAAVEHWGEQLSIGFTDLGGKGQLPHLERLLSLGRLRGIQWVPGDGQPQVEHWLELIKHIRQNGKLCQVYASVQEALTILRELGGKGLLLVINDSLTPEQGKALLNEIRRIEEVN